MVRVQQFALAGAVIAVVVGLFVPRIYDWTGQDQSYHSPRTTWLMIGIPIVALLFSISMIWWPKVERDHSVRFHLRGLLLATALLAIAFALIPIMPVVSSVILCISGYGYAIWLACDSRIRLAVISFVGCALAPFVWVFGFDHPWETNPLVAGMLPAFLPSLVTASLTDMNLHKMNYLPALLTGVQFFASLSLARLGGRWSVAVNTWTLVCSIFGSLILHAMIRA